MTESTEQDFRVPNGAPRSVTDEARGISGGAGLSRSTEALLLAVITLGALGLRLLWVDHPELWLDERFSLVYARSDLAHLLSLDRTTDIHPPGFYLIVKATAALFGESRLALRMPSVLFGTASVPLLYALVRFRLPAKPALLAAAFLAVMPVHLHYSREMRAYATLGFALLLATYAFTRMAYSDHRPKVWAAIYALALAATFHLHYSAVTYFPLFGLAALGVFAIDRDRSRLVFLIGATFVAGLLCLPQAVHFLGFASGGVTEIWLGRLTVGDVVAATLGAYPFPWWGKPLVYLGYVAGAVLLIRRDRKLAVIAFVFLCLGLVIMAIVGIFKPVYLVRSIQAFTLLAPLLLALAVARLPGRALWGVVPLLAVIHLLPARPDYPPDREANIWELAIPAVATLPEGTTVFYAAHLEEAFRVPDYDLSAWRPLDLLEPDAGLALLDETIAACRAAPAGCGAFAVIMEADPMVNRDKAATWMSELNRRLGRAEVIEDRRLKRYRYLVFRP